MPGLTLTMHLTGSDQLDLVDMQRREIGSIAVERIEAHLIEGEFTPGAAYGSVEPLFEQFERAVDAQALAVVESLDRQIAALGLRVRRAGDHETGEEHPVCDVQIWSDGGISLRLCGERISGNRE